MSPRAQSSSRSRSDTNTTQKALLVTVSLSIGARDRLTISGISCAGLWLIIELQFVAPTGWEKAASLPGLSCGQSLRKMIARFPLRLRRGVNLPNSSGQRSTSGRPAYAGTSSDGHRSIIASCFPCPSSAATPVTPKQCIEPIGPFIVLLLQHLCLAQRGHTPLAPYSPGERRLA
jgi:hypothetical protein